MVPIQWELLFSTFAECYQYFSNKSFISLTAAANQATGAVNIVTLPNGQCVAVAAAKIRKHLRETCRPYASFCVRYSRFVTLNFDLLKESWHSGYFCLETFTPMFCYVFLSSSYKQTDGRTDKRAGKTHNAAYYDGRIDRPLVDYTRNLS